MQIYFLFFLLCLFLFVSCHFYDFSYKKYRLKDLIKNNKIDFCCYFKVESLDKMVTKKWFYFHEDIARFTNKKINKIYSELKINKNDKTIYHDDYMKTIPIDSGSKEIENFVLKISNYEDAKMRILSEFIAATHRNKPLSKKQSASLKSLEHLLKSDNDINYELDEIELKHISIYKNNLKNE